PGPRSLVPRKKLHSLSFLGTKDQGPGTKDQGRNRMSFKAFIYYCALCGGWAALATWAVVQFTPVGTLEWKVLQGALIGGLLGLLVAAAIGALDALQNAVGFQRVLRVLICLLVGLVGGLAGGALGTALYLGVGQQLWCLLVGWVLTGVLIG